MNCTTLSLAAVLSLATGFAWADSHETAEAEAEAGATEGTDQAAAGMEGMDHSGMEGDPNSAMLGYIAAMETSMDLMPSDSTGDADADFLMVMIPHHQSAVDMARIVLEVGDDPAVLELARMIMENQEAEITAMQEMLAAMQVEGVAASGEAEAPVENVTSTAATEDAAGAAGLEDGMAPADGEAASE